METGLNETTGFQQPVIELHHTRPIDNITNTLQPTIEAA